MEGVYPRGIVRLFLNENKAHDFFANKQTNQEETNFITKAL